MENAKKKYKAPRLYQRAEEFGECEADSFANRYWITRTIRDYQDEQ